MDEHSAGIITFERIAKILNNELYNEDAVDTFISVTEEKKQEREDTIRDIAIKLSDYFKNLQNVDFDEVEFKKLCCK